MWWYHPAWGNKIKWKGIRLFSYQSQPAGVLVSFALTSSPFFSVSKVNALPGGRRSHLATMRLKTTCSESWDRELEKACVLGGFSEWLHQPWTTTLAVIEATIPSFCYMQPNPILTDEKNFRRPHERAVWYRYDRCTINDFYFLSGCMF